MPAPYLWELSAQAPAADEIFSSHLYNFLHEPFKETLAVMLAFGISKLS